MLDNEPTGAAGASNDDINPATGRPRRRAASRPAGPPPPVAETEATPAPARRSRAKKAAAPVTEPAAAEVADAEKAPAKKTAAKRTRKRAAAPAETEPVGAETTEQAAAAPAPRKRTRPKAAVAAPAFATPEVDAPAENPRTRRRRKSADALDTDTAETAETTDDDGVAPAAAFQPPGVVFQPPSETAPSRRRKKAAAAPVADENADETDDELEAASDEDQADAAEGDTDEDGAPRRRRRRGGRGRRGRGGRPADGSEDAEGADVAESADASGEDDAAEGETDSDGEQADGESTSSRRRRRRRRGSGDSDSAATDDPPNTVTKVREPRKRGGGGGGSRSRDDDEVTGLRGSTRIEAKKQRRREGREAGRRRPPVLTESEFLARREAVERVMVIREKPERTQIAVLEDGVLVEHHVSGHDSAASMVGNVYLGRVQNVLPSMEAAFVDIGRGRNAVLYAGEVNWDAVGLEGQPKRIEHALKSGDPVLVQVTKDPVGQKGARLTSQISLPGRYLVYVPEGSMNGISRKLPDTERTRLKAILKRVVPEQAGVIVRTAAEGASEEELVRDVNRLSAQWDDIDAKIKSGSTTAPSVLYGEPDLTTRVVRDIFNEDFTKLIVSGADAWETVEQYVGHVAPDLAPRLEKWAEDKDVFTSFRVDEQLLKALDRKVYLPSGGSLVIDRTEAMTVVDVNTGKFTGQGGNLEATVTENNLEAAEEIVRQLRLRDVGGIIVIDFIDMVLEVNRDLVTRRLLECLGRDRTKHQVAEVTSLGLVQMTRKRVGAGLLEVFSEPCDCCNGRGLKISLDAPKKPDKSDAAEKAAQVAKAAAKPAKPAKHSGDAEDSADAEAKPAKKATRSRKRAKPAAESDGEAAASAETAPEAPAGATEADAEPATEPATKPKARRSRAKAAPKAKAEPAAE